MIEQGVWGLVGVLGALSAYQQCKLYRLHKTAKQREELFQIVTENAADMIALVDVKGRRLYNSPAYKRILGYSPAELSETSAFQQIHPDDRLKVLEAAQEARNSGVGKRLEYRIRHKDGTWRVLESIAGTIRGEDGEVAKLVIVNRDITQRKHAEELVEHQNLHDTLTGLPNRRVFLHHLEHLFHQAKRNTGTRYALLLIDIDRLKMLNESMGTAAGDAVIVEIGRRVSFCLRQNDIVASAEAPLSENSVSRFGNDEFAVLLDLVSDPSDAMRVAHRIQNAVTAASRIEGHEVCTSLSIGIAMSSPEHQRVEDIIQEAEIAVRRAKGLGGHRCEVFDEAMHTSAVRRLRLEAELKTAIEKQQFRVYYQPVMRLHDKQLAGFEALLRWQHPDQGLVSPAKFLEVAEDTGLLVAIGQWLISEVCNQLSAWRAEDQDRSKLYVSVNLSSRQLTDARLVADLRRILQRTGIDPSSLQLEVSENAALAATQPGSSVVSQLRQLGVAIIIDDFGAGQFSLLQLCQFPVNALKIDHRVVSEMMTSRGAFQTVELIITLAHRLNLQVIAEGIELSSQLTRLRELGCDFGQGYLFSQPLEPELTRQLLNQQRDRRSAASGH